MTFEAVFTVKVKCEITVEPTETLHAAHQSMNRAQADARRVLADALPEGTAVIPSGTRSVRLIQEGEDED